MMVSLADHIREYATRTFVDPGRRHHETRIRVAVRDVHDGLKLSNQFPAVCNALRSRKFLVPNRLILEAQEGPPSGQSSTVAFTFRIVGEPEPGQNTGEPSLMSLRGIGKEVFQRLGGGEAFIRRERERFYTGGAGA